MATSTPGLLFARWYLQEVAARNCCGGLRQVAVVVEIIQNYERWIVVALDLEQWVLRLGCRRNCRKSNQIYVKSVY
jgi:hypothetical protein